VCAEGVAAGAMLSMIATATPNKAAAQGKPSEVGLITAAGFLAAAFSNYSGERIFTFAVSPL